MRLIGLTGRAGCGKDTVAGFLCEAHGFVQIALADALRHGLRAMLGLTEEQMTRRDLKEQLIDWLGRSPRELLQTLGTEWGRNHVAQDVWLRVAARQIEKTKRQAPCLHISGIVVSDIRFENEAQWLRGLGGQLWHIERPGLAAALSVDTGAHVSEQGVRGETGDLVVVNGGTLDELFQDVGFALGEAIQ